EIKNLSISYGYKPVIKNLSMNIKKNKITAIIGPSGCGKSTLLNTLNLMIGENGGNFIGEILFKSRDILNYEKNDIRKMIGMVFQQRSEEHTSELQSRFDIVCRLLLEKKKQKKI